MSQARAAMTSRSVDDLARTLAPQRPSSAPTSSMDSLARSLAMPMPRRRALRLLGSALVLAAVPALRPSRARATGGGVEAGPNIEAGPDIIDPPEGPFGPPVRCGDTVCNPASNCVKCCPAQGGGGSCCPCYFSCTTTGSGLCNKQVACPPDGRPFCGPPGHCCASNESCYRGSICLPICKPGEELCEDDCCPRGTECANLPLPGGRARRVCTAKCPGGRTRCGLTCCPKRGWKCVNPGRSLCSPCDIGQKPCGRRCCARGSTCCDPQRGLCCKRNETCAGYGGVAKCCPKGTRACETTSGSGNPICCKKGETCAQVADGSGTVPSANRRKYTCCPPNRAVSFGGGVVAVCCPDGYRSLGGRFILPAGGGGGLCCREDKLCGDTCCGTNSDPGINQTCCNGRCVSLFFDSNNCGGCGARCGPGTRCQGGTCRPA